MSYLLDTGILLRLVNDKDAQHSTIRLAVRELIRRNDDLLITTQNVAEFWNVATRPVANNGLSLKTTDVVQLLQREIEPICVVLPEQASLFAGFKRLLTTYDVIGKQVHDARLVAMMLTWQVGHILTLNERNFLRFTPEGITVVSPTTIIAPNP
jgi:predicted nucleic acid-binding protein